MFSEILIDTQIQGYCSTSENTIANLSQINIMVGKNNSGKSRLLRKIFSSDDLKYKSVKFKTDKIANLITTIKPIAKELKENFGLANYDRILGKVAALDIDEYWNRYLDINNDVKALENLKKTYDDHNSGHSRRIADVLKKDCDELLNLLQTYVALHHKQKRIYVPTLRGLKHITSTGDVYKNKCLTDYFANHPNATIVSDGIYTGLSLYQDATELLLGTTDDRERIKQFEYFLQNSFFDGEIVNIVPRLGNVLHIRIGNDEYPIHELGDGIQSIIILTYPLFFNQGTNVIFCFEEPETHLHPGLQRLFIETLQKTEFHSFQYFISTHSNHFLDLTIDFSNISVYTFTKNNNEDERKFLIENIDSSNKRTLELIGARTSSVFLSNCTIWVEGITDRLYIRKLLEIYQKEQNKVYKEDYHFSFVEYGGNNITHWSFLDNENQEHSGINVDRLCSKLFLITDNDGAGLTINGQENKTKHKKYERHLQLLSRLGKERYYRLRCREIENILSKEIIKQVIIDREDNDKLNFIKFDKNVYSDKALGKYIEDNVNVKRKYADGKSGTIYDKINFCKSAIKNIHSIDDLTDEAKELCKRLYAFIKSNN